MKKSLAAVLTLLLLLTLPVFADETPAPEGATDAKAGEAAAAEEALPEQTVEDAIEEFNATNRLPETAVTATRSRRVTFDLPKSVTVIEEGTITQLAPRYGVAAISDRDPGIIQDIRTVSTGDPIMRGFAGFNLLALIDGNTLSTLWGEGGFGADDMYGKIDIDTIERIEVVRGPNSVLYGSNALGGVFNFITRSSPIDYTSAGYAIGGRVKGTYMSNMGGYRGRFETYGATEDVKWLIGLSTAHYGDGRSGEKELDPTSGSERNFDIRADIKVAEGNEITVSILDVYRWNQHRYYRPTQENKNHRLGVALGWTSENLFDFTELFEWRLYYQKKRDERVWNEATVKKGYAQTITWATDVQAISDAGAGHLLTYGLHASVDKGESADDEQFTFWRPSPKRADAPKTDWWNYAVFLQDEWEIVDDTFTATLAARYDYFIFKSKETSAYVPPVGDPELDYFRDTTGSLTGGLGLVYKIDPNWNAVGSWSRGFRQYAPNFGIRQLGNGVLIPNELLDPVVAYNYEVGLKARYPWIDAEGYLYYSDINDWQELRPDTFLGQDWYDYNGNGVQDANENIISQKGVEDAYVWGFELKSTIYISEAIEGMPEGYSVWGGFAWNRGKTGDGEYFRHTQPARGLLGARWDDADPKRAIYVEFVAEMVDNYHRIPEDRKQNDLAYKKDPQDKNSGLLRSYGGVPGYTVFSLYAGMNLCESSKLTLGIENLTDKKFRRAHSRMDALGINFFASVEVVF
jgi:hemoglobin/transferrin/lactoferrin receptor protein